jgi:hypothetical protein
MPRQYGGQILFGRLKGEQTAHRTQATRQEAEAAISPSSYFTMAHAYTRIWAIAAPMMMRHYSRLRN